MVSTWDHNEYRENTYLLSIWRDCHKITKEHFYHVGAKESNRRPMVEALLTNYTVEDVPVKDVYLPTESQLLLFEMAIA